MNKPRQFTPLESAAMDAVAYYARPRGGAKFLIDQFGLNPRTAARLVGKQQPPPAGIAERLGDYLWDSDTDYSAEDMQHIKALEDFVTQRRTPKGGDHA